MTIPDWIMDWVQIWNGVVLFLTLVAILVYVCETRRMAKATSKMAEEAEQQRLALWEPWIQPYVRAQTIGIDKVTHTGRYEVLYPNTGKGDAYRVERYVLTNTTADVFADGCSGGRHPNQYPGKVNSDAWPHIPSGAPQDWIVDPLAAGSCVAVALYRDRFGRQFISGYAFRVEHGNIRSTSAIAPRLFEEKPKVVPIVKP